MIETVSNCVGCEVCRGCSNEQEVHYCDCCGTLIDGTAYVFDGDEICQACCIETIAKLIRADYNAEDLVRTWFSDLVDYYNIDRRCVE